ncbi:transglycosylase domain-containing protein [Flavobacterium sp. ASW18X]|uniref:transglycosylase domain-containing protein n=1 Tax=Flavobacterium sp. ASW18X TaxID=2572595 RepID=UPI0010AE500E|nr:transglycosylase domain-containing protein [Flavobacterium sp. ASW18X]TKD55689.1 penicillin-binding protein [Flavobacterium sp. ASW18X]
MKTFAKKKKLLKTVAIFLATALLIPLLFVFAVYIGVFGKLPTKQELATIEHQQASEVYSADGFLIGKFYLNDRQPIPLERMPQNLLQALISIEDERFHDHNGIDLKSMFRVAFKSILLGDKSAGGGSTLTQQLAKNLYPRKERTSKNLAVNKIKEMLIAKRLEANYDKDKVLELYLNTVSFGDNTFGIEAAARKFFDKPTDSLLIEESAVLVGMLKATYGYNPRLFPERSLERRNLVLYNMQRNSFIAEEEKDSLQQLPLVLKYRDYDHNNGIAPYFREAVRKEVLAWAHDKDVNIYTSGLKIQTTLHYGMQQLAEEAMIEHMKKLQKQFEDGYGLRAPWLSKKSIMKAAKKLSKYKHWQQVGLSEKQIQDSLSIKRKMTFPTYNGEEEVMASSLDSLQHFMKFLNVGSIGIHPKSGAVNTWIGGVNFSYFKYDHVNQSKRQVGSTFKPIVYLTALENGISPCDYFSAREVEYQNLKGWSPSNSGNKDEAYLNYSLEEALSQSVNTVTVKVLEKTGLEKVLAQATEMGIQTDLPKEPSIALGTGEIPMTEMASVYSSFINHGRPIRPYIIQQISSNQDSVLYKHQQEKQVTSAFSEDNRKIMLHMMQSVVNNGTASRLRSTYGLKNAIAGKTGTTQNNKDAWFAALTPNYVNITWVGLDNHEIGFSNTAIGQGANAALPIFAKLYQKMNAESQFDSITKATFSPLTPEQQAKLACDPIKKDGFLKRLFTNPKKKKKKKFRG